MAGNRTSTLQVKFEVDGEGRVISVLNSTAGAGDRAARSLDHLSNSADVGRDRMARLTESAKLAGAVLGTAVVAGLFAVTRATIESEKADAQLEARLRSTQGVAGLTKAALDDLATATARKTTFDDEAVKSAEALLLTFTKINGDTFPRAIQIITDMSVAMDQGLKESAIQVGKALNDPILGITALSRVGIQFSESQKAVIKQLVETNRIADAQRVILGELETQMGGSAEAARDTLGGALEGLKNSAEDLLEGDSGDAGLNGVRESIEQLTDVLNDPDTRAGFQSLISDMAELASEAAHVIAMIVDLYQELPKLQGVVPAAGQRQASPSDFLRGQRQGWEALLRGDMAGARAGTQLSSQGLQSIISRSRAGTVDDVSGAPALSSLELQSIVEGLGTPFNAAGAAPFDITAFGGGGKGGKGKSDTAEAAAAKAAAAAQRAAAQAARERAQAERELREQVEQVVAAHDDFTGKAEDLRAELEGPLAQAQLAYNRQLAEFRDLAKRGEISATDLAAAERDLAEQHEREADAIRKRLDPAADLIQQLDDELRLRTLNNAEARAAVDIANLAVPATKAEAAAIVDRYHALQAQADAADAMDAFRDSSKHAWLEFASGAEGAGDAAKDFFNDLAGELLKLFTDRAWEQLFGSRGSVNGGSAGGGLASLASAIFGGGGGAGNAGLTEEQMYAKSVSAGGLSGGGSGSGFWSTVAGFFGAIFGGNRAAGGDTLARHFYRVNEQQPELLEYDGQTLLMMGSRGGRVRPMQPAMAGGNTYNISVGVEGRVDRRTRSQIAGEIEQQSRRARGRNG
jgi:hypothetical protein